VRAFPKIFGEIMANQALHRRTTRMARKSTVLLAAVVIASAVEFVVAFIYAWGMTGSDVVHRVGRHLHWPSSLLTDWIIGDGKGLRLGHEFFLNVGLQFGLLFC